MKALTIAGLLIFTIAAYSAEPELIPLAPPAIVVPQSSPVLAFERPSHMAVWQYYAVDRHGRFRPREPLSTVPYQRAMINSRVLIPYMFD